jgi:hypothetical protein
MTTSLRRTTSNSIIKWALLGAASYALAALLHEGVGHGLGCLLAGGDIELVTSSYLSCSRRGALIDVAGPVANAIAFVAFAALASWAKSYRRPVSRFASGFCWLEAAWNLYWFTGYLLYSGLTDHGDWSLIAQSLPMGPYLLMAAGLLATIQGIRWFRRSNPFGQANTLFAAYAGGSAAALFAAAFDPAGFVGLLLRAPPAAPLAGICLLLSVDRHHRSPIEDGVSRQEAGFRDVVWLGGLVIGTLFFIGVLGPGWRP